MLCGGRTGRAEEAVFAVWSKSTDLLAMIDKCSREGANLLLWQRLLDDLLYLKFIHVLVDVAESLQYAAYVGIDAEFRAFMYPCHCDTGYMTSDSSHGVESSAVAGALAYESLKDSLCGFDSVRHLLASMA